jgi:hypothetical protein
LTCQKARSYQFNGQLVSMGNLPKAAVADKEKELKGAFDLGVKLAKLTLST